MRKFIIFLILITILQKESVGQSEFQSRGIPTTYTIQSKRIKGYVLNWKTLNETKKNLTDLLKDWTLSEDQITFMVDFYINTGFAESCYIMDSMIFSIEKQVNGKAIGFIQVEPSTATQVIDEVFESNNEEYINNMENICERSFGFSLKELKSVIKNRTISTLNDDKISMFVFFLKFSNRKWKDIPGFLNNEPNGELKSQAKIWKIVWNTYRGKGTIDRYIRQVKECKENI